MVSGIEISPLLQDKCRPSVGRDGETVPGSELRPRIIPDESGSWRAANGEGAERRVSELPGAYDRLPL
jgi:hypothetical protein